MQKLIRALVSLSVAACLALLALGSPASAAPQKRTTRTGHFDGRFSATIVQGPQAGTSYAGTLAVSGDRHGRLTGTLTTADGKHIAVIGQLHGQLIGLSFSVGTGQAISGVGVVGYDRTTKHNTVGGTFSGPAEGSFGVWSYVAQTPQGGCLVGISTTLFGGGVRPGLCYVADGR